MANPYLVLKRKHETEVNNFPMVFAFSNKQFEEAMEKIGLAVNDTDKVYSIGAGGFIRKTDSEAFNEMFERHAKEMEEAIASDPTGDGFIYQMFDYELANHEYNYTGEIESTLDALGITLDEVRNNPALKNGLTKARRTASML